MQRCLSSLFCFLGAACYAQSPIDITAFTLESGRKVSVLEGWRGDRDERAFLRTVHDAACADFRTVLGPNADAAHRDHLHLDLQNRRNGSSYCR